MSEEPQLARSDVAVVVTDSLTATAALVSHAGTVMTDAKRYVQTLAELARHFGVTQPGVAYWIRSQGAPGKTPLGYDLNAMSDWRSARNDEAPGFARTQYTLAKALGVCRSSVYQLIREGAPEKTAKGYDISGFREFMQARETAKEAAKSTEEPLQDEPETIPAADSIEWKVLLSEMRKAQRARWREKHSEKNAPRVRTAAIDASIVNAAEEILRRPPVASDLDADFVTLLMMKLKRTNLRARSLKVRLAILQRIASLAEERYGIPPVDFTEVHAGRRTVFEEPVADTTPAPPLDEKEYPPEYDRAILSMPLAVLLKDHYARERLIGKSKQTSRLYRVSINNFGKWLGRRPVVSDLRQRTVVDYLNWNVDQGERSLATVEKERVQLLTLWRYCARKRWLPTFPEIPPINVPERVPDAWSRQELGMLVGACRGASGDIGDVPASLLFEAVVSIIFDTAERVTAVMSIEWDNIGRDGWLTVGAETRKGKRRDKRFKLRPETLALIERLRKYRKPEERQVLPWPYHPSYLYQRYGAILKAAGLPSNRRSKFHKLRRTTASEFEAAGGNATELLDHESRKTTLAYLDPRVLKSVQPADIVPGLGQILDRATETDDDSELLAEIGRLITARRKQGAA